MYQTRLISIESQPKKVVVVVVVFVVVIIIIIAKLSPAQSNSNSVGWAEIALISTFTSPHTPPPPPPGKAISIRLLAKFRR